MLAPNTRLKDRYRILHKIGGGGFGNVYEAIDEVFGCSVAIKETREEVAGLDKLQKAFEREGKLLRNLKHDALPRVTDYFFHDKAQFLVMDFIKGQDLATLLKRRSQAHQGPFSCEELLPWADKILSALEYLHSRSEPIIHRDIKPANIKLADDGGVYLLDFGLAKGATGQMSTMLEGQSSFSVAAFTHEYAPLEQLQNTGTEPTSDIYALGATIYHLLTGQPPVSASRRDEAMQRGQGDPLRPAHELNPAIPPALSQVITQALAVRWWDRISSAKEMRSALEHAWKEMDPVKPGSMTLATSQSTQLDAEGSASTLPLPQRAKLAPSDKIEPAVSVTGTPRSVRRLRRSWLIAGLTLVVFIGFAAVIRLVFPHWFARAGSTKPDAHAQRPTERVMLTDVSSLTNLSLKKVLSDHTQDPKKHVWSLAFSRDGSLAASASEDGTIILWDTKTWRPKFPPLTGHTREVYSVAFSSDDRILASGSRDTSIKLWDTQTGQLISSALIQGAKPVLRVAFSPDGNFLASCSGKVPEDGGDEIRLWNVRGGWKLILESQVTNVYAIEFSPDSEMLASAGLDGQLLLWELMNNWQSRVLVRGDSKLTTLAFSPDGKYLACGSSDTTIKLWLYQPQTKVKWRELEGPIGAHNSYITSIAFSRDNKTLVSATIDARISLWDVTTKPPTLLHVTQSESQASQWSVAFSPDGQTLLTGGEDNMVRVWQ